jgi:hypothetical protein
MNMIHLPDQVEIRFATEIELPESIVVSSMPVECERCVFSMIILEIVAYCIHITKENESSGLVDRLYNKKCLLIHGYAD